MSGLGDMRRQRENSRKGATGRKPPSRHARDRREGPGSGGEPKVEEVGGQDVEHGPEKPGEGSQPQGGGEQPQPQVDPGEKGAQAPKVEPKPKAAAKPAAKKSPASSAKRADQAADGQDPVLGGAVVALRGEPERKAVETAALEWAAAARKLGEKAAKLKTTVDLATAAGTPPELIVAALVQAEGRSGYKVPDQVRSIAEGVHKAR